MKAVIILVVLVCAMGLVAGDLVCGTNYCKENPCSNKIPASSCSKGSVYRANHSGKCACCPACVTLLSEGETCKTYSKEIGETPTAICKDNLQCIRGTCQTVSPRH